MSGRRWAAARSPPVSPGRAPPTTGAAWPRTGCRCKPVPDRGSRPSARPRRGARRERSRSERPTGSATAPVTAPATGGRSSRARRSPPLRYQDTSSKVTFSASWRRYTTSSASGGHTRYATRRGAAVTFRFTGRAVRAHRPEGTDPWQREAVRRWRLRQDDQPVSIAFRATDRGRGTVVVELGRAHGEAGPGRDRGPPALRRRRLRDPEVAVAAPRPVRQLPR